MPIYGVLYAIYSLLILHPHLVVEYAKILLYGEELFWVTVEPPLQVGQLIMLFWVTDWATIAGGPAYYVLHPLKGITIFHFLTYQGKEGIFSPTNLAEWFREDT